MNQSVFSRDAEFAVEDPSLGTNSLLSERMNAVSSLRRVSELSGGFTVANQGDLRAGLHQIVLDTSRYYLLGFSPSEDGEPGELEPIEVRVKREGLTVRSRYGYAVPDESEESDRRAVPDREPSLTQALRSPVPSAAIPLRVTAAPMGEEDGNALVPVVVHGDVHGFDFKEDQGRLHDAVEVRVRASEHDGEIVESKNFRVDLAVPAAMKEHLMDSGFRAETVLRLAPGSYRVRVAVHESGADRVGSVDLDLDVPRPSRGDPMLRGLALTSESEMKIPAARAAEEQTILPLTLSPERSFPRNDVLIALVELSNPRERDADLVFEVLDAVGRPAYVFAGQTPPTEGAEIVVLPRRLPLEDFGPGDYYLVLRLLDPSGVELSSRFTPFSVH